MLFYIVGIFIKFLAFFSMLHNNCLDFLWQSGKFFTACRQRPEKLVSLKICNSWPFLVWFLSCHHGSYGLEYLFCCLFDMLPFGLFSLSLWSKRSDFWREPESHWPDWQKSKKIVKGSRYQEKECQETSPGQRTWH